VDIFASCPQVTRSSPEPCAASENRAHYFGYQTAAPAALFFQFANSDRFIPKDVAQQFFDAGSEPKSINWYDAPHALNEQARADRVQWISEQLDLKLAP
jgi:hypothetical protein